MPPSAAGALCAPTGPVPLHAAGRTGPVPLHAAGRTGPVPNPMSLGDGSRRGADPAPAPEGRIHSTREGDAAGLWRMPARALLRRGRAARVRARSRVCPMHAALRAAGAEVCAPTISTCFQLAILVFFLILQTPELAICWSSQVAKGLNGVRLFVIMQSRRKAERLPRLAARGYARMLFD